MKLFPKYISEVSSNHGQDLDRILEFISASKRCGCDAVKFQLFKIDELYSREAIDRFPHIEDRRKWELPVEFIERIANEAHAQNLSFGCTPFYLDAVEELSSFVDFFKIASYELLWHDLIKKCCEYAQPLIISTGMATMDEVVEAKKIVDLSGKQNVAFLHCESSYPVSAEEANLAAISTMRSTLGCTVGWSDHSRDPAVVLRAAMKWGAEIFEFHIDLDETGAEYGAGHCWLPNELEEVITLIERGKIADGDGVKQPGISERDDRSWRADPKDGLRPLIDKRMELIDVK